MERNPFLEFPGLIGAQESVGMRISFVAGVLVSVIAAAAAAGISLAISTFVVPALHELPDGESVRAVQYLVLYVVPPAFLAIIMATGAYGVSLVGIDVLTRGRRASPWLIAGMVVYVLGVVAVTLFGTVPLEYDFLAMDSTALKVDAWISYATAWAGYNNLRLLSASVSALFFLIAMLRR